MYRLLSVLVAGAVLGAVAIWFITMPKPPFARDDPRFQIAGNPARGQMVFAAGDCASCHASPGQSDRLRLGGGIALSSSFGTFRPPNISPDQTDGIGAWSAADLANALIGGVSPRGTHYYPAFPYPSYTGMHLQDINDLMAYLRTLPPISGRAPPHRPTLLFRIRRFVGFWKTLFFHEGKPDYEPAAGGADDRGGYLVESVAHCAECHSERNLLGAVKPAHRFAGATDPEGTGFIPNITPNRIGHWSQDDIAEMLKSGNTPDHGRVGSSMADVVTNTAMLPQNDRDAIARYIKALPARETPRP